MIPLEVAGESLQLLPDRAVFWPRRSTLIMADVHLGKGAAFRRAGVAVPSGSTQADLDRIERLLDRTRPARLLVLGDLFHTRVSPDEPTIAAIDAFRERHPALVIEAIRGNHDRGIERLPARWRIDWIAGGLFDPPFVFVHEPVSDPRGYVLCGHVHPVFTLRSRLDSLRLPVFWFGDAARVGLLPSFGEFTGGYAVRPDPLDRLIGVTPDGLVALQSGSRPSADLEANPCIT